jgi:hypothetical protein
MANKVERNNKSEKREQKEEPVNPPAQPPHSQHPGAYQYAVKFVCGKSRGEVMARGRYYTAINVHNPTYGAVTFKKKFAVAKPGETAGPVSDFFSTSLGPDEAFEIDCPDILQHTNCAARFLKGFAVIISPVELDVVAVYTAEGRDKRVETLHMERVRPRKMTVGPAPCVDFEDLQLGTVYHVPDTFTSSAATISVRPFQWIDTTWTADGFATVGNAGNAGGSGQELAVNNVNLSFGFGGPIQGLTLRFGDQGGNLNIDVNGDFLNFPDFSALPPTLGGVTLSVAGGTVQGELNLSGTINSFAIGGQEFSIDDVCPKRQPSAM